jgi:hypothetical protein
MSYPNYYGSAEVDDEPALPLQPPAPELDRRPEPAVLLGRRVEVFESDSHNYVNSA